MNFSTAVERLIRSRLVRLLLALVLIAVGVWAFLPHIAYRVASSAFVNAELVRVTAPMAGRLSRDLPRKGDIIEHSITVNLIEALSPDRRHLMELEQQSAVAKDRASLAKKQIAEIETIDRGLESRTASYRSGAIERLGQQIAEAEAEKTGCLAENEQRLDVGSRMEQLAKSGYTSQIRSAEASATQEANAARCQMAAARVQRLKIERDSAQTGVYLGDGASDVPYSQQQRDRLVLRRQELETEILQQELERKPTCRRGQGRTRSTRPDWPFKPIAAGGSRSLVGLRESGFNSNRGADHPRPCGLRASICRRGPSGTGIRTDQGQRGGFCAPDRKRRMEAGEGPAGIGFGCPHRRSATCRASSSPDIQQYFGRS